MSNYLLYFAYGLGFGVFFALICSLKARVLATLADLD